MPRQRGNRAATSAEAVGGVAGLEFRQAHAEYLFVFVVRAEEYVALLHQRRQYLLRFLAVFPEVLAVVDVARDGQAHFPGDGDRFSAYGGRVGAHRGRDARPVEPRSTVEEAAPVYHPRAEGVEGRVGTVVDDVGGAHGCGLLHIIKSQPLAAAEDAVGSDAVAAQVVEAGIGHAVLGQAGDEFAAEPEIGQRNGHVGFAAAVAGAEQVGLVETQIVGRREPQHDLSESDDFLVVHGFSR